MTATFMVNKLLDLKNYLSLLYHDKFDVTASDYYKIINVLNVYKQFALDNDVNFHLLNFLLFSYLFHYKHILSERTLIALSCILNKIQLQHVMRTEMKMNDDKSNIVIDSDISSYDIKTVKMKMTFLQMTQYA